MQDPSFAKAKDKQLFTFNNQTIFYMSKMPMKKVISQFSQVVKYSVAMLLTQGLQVPIPVGCTNSTVSVVQ